MAVVDVTAVKSIEYSIESQKSRIREEIWVDVYAGDFADEGRLVWTATRWSSFALA